MKKLGIINGSLGGSQGNCGQFLEKYLAATLPKSIVANVLTLADAPWKPVAPFIKEHDGFLVVTGTYWDNWSSLLQRFLEEITPLEGSSAVLGKPCGALVTMHATGGKEVLSRLQGVFSTLGFLIPPLSGMVYSMANQIALSTTDPLREDLWHPQDCAILTHNLTEAMHGTNVWKSWPVGREEYSSLWLS